jgi:hypothetical protein
MNHGTYDRLTFSLCTAFFFPQTAFAVPIEIFPINQDCASIISCSTLALLPFYDLTPLFDFPTTIICPKNLSQLVHPLQLSLARWFTTCFG